MKAFALLTLMFAVAATAQTSPSLSQVQASGSTVGASQSVRVLSPQPGDRIANSSVTVKYQIVQPGSSAEASPTYKIQMDGTDPLETLATEYSFTGLAPGAHLFLLDLVDANHTPIAGSHTEVRFTVVQNPPPKS